MSYIIRYYRDTNQTSDWALSQVMIWSGPALTDADMQAVSSALLYYLDSGVFSTLPTGQPTSFPSAMPTRPSPLPTNQPTRYRMV